MVINVSNEEILEVDMRRRPVCNNHGVLSYMLLHYLVYSRCCEVVKDEHLYIMYDFPL